MTAPNSSLAVIKAAEKSTYLAKLEQAAKTLSECISIKEVKTVAAIAAAAKEYAKRLKLGKEMQLGAHRVEVDALTRMGEILAQTPKAKGTKGQLAGRDPSGHSKMEAPEDTEPTLKAMGISEKESQESQALARAKKEWPEGHEAARNGDVTSRHIAQVMAQAKPMTPEEIEARNAELRKKIETRRFLNIVELLVVGECSTPKGREFIARHLQVSPFKFKDLPDPNLSPNTMLAAGRFLQELAHIWKGFLP